MENKFENIAASPPPEEEFIDKTYMFYHTPVKLLILLGLTVLFSIIYKCLIEMGVFKLIHNEGLHRLVYCLFELLILGGFWHCVFIFAKACKHRSHSLRAHYLMIGIVSGLYTVIICLLYRFLSFNLYSWIMRITLNLCGLRFRATFPKNLTPYLIAYLIITILIIMLEPVIAKRRYKRYVRKMKGLPGPLESKIEAFYDSRDEKRFRKAMQKKKKKKEKKKQKKLKEEERYQKRKAKWEMKRKKRREKEKRKAGKKNR